MPECEYSEPDLQAVDIAALPGGDDLVAALATVDDVPATWWDGAAGTLELGFEFDAGTLIAQETFVPTAQSNVGCPTFNYWSMGVLVAALGTADGNLSALAEVVVLECDDNLNNAPAPRPSKNPLCPDFFTFVVPVAVDAGRAPPEVSGPYEGVVTVNPDLPRGFSVLVVTQPATSNQAATNATSTDTHQGTSEPRPVEILRSE